MKKLIIAAAIVCAAALSHGASMKWKVVTGVSGLNIYICASVAEFENVAQIEANLLGTSGNTATSASKSHDSWFGNSGVVAGIDPALEQKGATFYAVVVDSSNKGYYTMSGTADIYTTATEPEQGLVDLSAKIAAGNYTPWAGGPGPEPIPEPTSGLLLLLGVAGLALRRRHA